MKIKKTLSINEWVIRAFCKQYPLANRNFSATVEAALISTLKNPIHFWISKLDYHESMMHMARDKVKYYKLLQDNKDREEIQAELAKELK